ncbi:hypothetical protein C5167_020285 [Papaver somniferum]|uniref:Metallo-beta-lactamase domain-containing protein n=1 Tax=Papaver somniferum TaxID=3469 RepID=A0A4Y7ISL6_PAPSO|nr:hypothetical protein C5167_020285 [Papaver somniferum]
MGFLLGAIRIRSSPLSSFSNFTNTNSFQKSSIISFPKHGLSPIRRMIQASLHSKGESEIVFMGTGTSEGIPRVSCLTNPEKKCPVCSKAAEPGNKNRRLNTSILIRYATASGVRNILVDAGKFFYHSALKYFPAFGNPSGVNEVKTTTHINGVCPSSIGANIIETQVVKWKPLVLVFRRGVLGPLVLVTWSPASCFGYGGIDHPCGISLQGVIRCTETVNYWLRTIDAVIITHSHADAIGGLDDLRDWTNNVQPSIPIYVANRDFEVMKKTHYYLVDTSVIIPGAAVSELQFKIIEEEPFIVEDLKITPLPVWHGINYRSLGFRFGNVCYISDVSEIPEETYPLLEDCDLLIMDALRPDRSSSTHFGLPKALEEVRKIKPKRTLFTGMMHLMDHEIVNEYLATLMNTEGLDVQLSYDGLSVPVKL